MNATRWTPPDRVRQAAKHNDATRRATRIAALIRAHKANHIGCTATADCQGIGDEAAREIALMSPQEMQPAFAAALEQLAAHGQAPRTVGRVAA